MFSRDFPSFIFKINHVLIEKKRQLSKKVNILEEELHSLDVDGS